MRTSRHGDKGSGRAVPTWVNGATQGGEKKILSSKSVLRDVTKLSRHYQTSSLETIPQLGPAFHTQECGFPFLGNVVQRPCTTMKMQTTSKQHLQGKLSSSLCCQSPRRMKSQQGL
ncbi:hypothetical protein GJAV_G00084100 [Gymnothorax javanicus]|nr:hypothetical protein GJAV_G00084100 [Gymnothorax javanicus]